MNIAAMMQQAQKMQKEVMKVKDEIENKTFQHSNSLVEVEINGKKEILKISIKESFEFNKEDKEVLEDMLLLVLNEAFKKVDDELNSKMGKFAPGLNGLF